MVSLFRINFNPMQIDLYNVLLGCENKYWFETVFGIYNSLNQWDFRFL